MEDATNELMLSDEDSIRYAIGECFVHFERESAENRLESLTEETQKELDSAQSQIEEIQDQMKSLKASLYAKFGNSINLEE